MKVILRSLLINALVIFICSYLLPGFEVRGGYATYIVASFLLSIGVLILQPIVSILTLPLKIITLGLSNALTFGVVLLIITTLYTNVRIVPFTVRNANFLESSLNGFYAQGIFEYLLISVTMYIVYKFLHWIFN